MALGGALKHRARLVGRQRTGFRNPQGDFETLPIVGPWIKARVMERGGVAEKTRGANVSTEARVSRNYELLLAPNATDGSPVLKPTGSSVFETDCPVLDSPTIPLNGDAEVLNNGKRLIGYLAYGSVPVQRS